MIIRRFADALSGQNWGVVIIEVLIVVVGILIGLQLDDWNESRKDRRDAQVFMEHLHGDIVLADELASRVRQRRLEILDDALAAARVIFMQDERDTLTASECKAIPGLSALHINVPSLSSLTELASTGRMGIIRDVQLRRELIELQMLRASLRALIDLWTPENQPLPPRYPRLMQTDLHQDAESGEVRNLIYCDVAGMRADDAFLNDFGGSLDRFDGYVRDGLAPWSAQFDRVHAHVDAALAINHEPASGD